MIFERIKIRLKLTKDEIRFCNQNAGAVRWIYNQALAAQKEYYNSQDGLLNKKFIPTVQLSARIVEAKKNPHFSWLKDSDATSLQYALKNLNSAFTNYFKSKNGLRKGRKICFPKFKSKTNSKQSFTISNNNTIKVSDNLIKLSKLGWVRVWSGNKCLKKIIGLIVSATIYKDSDGNWYASVLCQKFKHRKVFAPAPTQDNVGGLDLGIKTTAITNTGVEFNIPTAIIKLEKKIAKLQRSLHRKQLKSKNREKARAKLSNCHFRIKKLRENFYHQLSALIATNVDILTIETLNIQGMMKNRKLSKSIATQGWYQFVTFLKYKFEKSGKILIQVDKWFPSSKLCSCCKWEFSNLNLSIREWECPNCNTKHDRDINAAANLNNISRWFKETGEIITTKAEYLAII